MNTDAAAAGAAQLDVLNRRVRRACWETLALCLLVLAVCLVLGRVNPFAPNCVLPRCLTFSMTGFYCPGCGSSRAVYSLLHADWRTAWRCNLLMVVWLPFMPWWCLRVIWHPCAEVGLKLAGEAGSSWWNFWLRPAAWPSMWEIHGRDGRIILWIWLVYSVARNLPGATWMYLRPF